MRVGDDEDYYYIKDDGKSPNNRSFWTNLYNKNPNRYTFTEKDQAQWEAHKDDPDAVFPAYKVWQWVRREGPLY